MFAVSDCCSTHHSNCTQHGQVGHSHESTYVRNEPIDPDAGRNLIDREAGTLLSLSCEYSTFFDTFAYYGVNAVAFLTLSRIMV